MALKVYVGQTRSRSLMRELTALGFGECTVRGELPPRRQTNGWFYDCGAFGDWQAGRVFDAGRFDRDMRAISNRGIGRGVGVAPITAPDFIVLPDQVAGGLESLAFSRQFLDGPWRPFGGYAAPLYMVVQDGMTETDVAPLVGQLGGIFVGGTVEWKETFGGNWVRFAHRRALRCHVGRVGGRDRVGWAKNIGCDSIDSCLPLWSDENLDRFKRALAEATRP